MVVASVGESAINHGHAARPVVAQKVIHAAAGVFRDRIFSRNSNVQVVSKETLASCKEQLLIDPDVAFACLLTKCSADVQ